MSLHSRQNNHMPPLESFTSESEGSSTSQQQPQASQADDVERGTAQNTVPPGTPLETVYIARPSIFIATVNHRGKIVHRRRDWVTKTTSEMIDNLPEVPPKGIRVAVINIGVDNESAKVLLKYLGKTTQSDNDSQLDVRSYKIPWKERLRYALRSSVYDTDGLNGEFSSLVGTRSVAHLNAHRLQQLCQEGAVAENDIFIAQSNILESSLPSSPYPDRYYMLHEEGSSSCRLQSSARSWYHGWSGLNLRFWETLSEVAVCRRDDGGAEALMFTFPALRLTSVPKAPDPKMVTPAQSSFETLLQSDQSSLRFLDLVKGNAELAIKLIILDSLRASMELWENFLRKLTTSTALPNPHAIGLIGYEKDMAHAIEFSSVVRDLCSCVSFLTSSITLDYFAEQSKYSRVWKHLLLEIRTSEDVLRNSVKRLLDIARPRFKMAVADSTASQAPSLRRLNIIAIIFLPMSLASSLLSMKVSVRGISEHWFDWLGLWMTMGFLVGLVYSLWKSIDYLKARPIAGRVISQFLKAVQNFCFPWLIPFCCVIIVSFWIGILDSLHTVPETLKWGFVALAGLVALRVLWYILLYLVKFLSYGLHKSHGKRRIWYLLMGCEIYINLTRVGGKFGDMVVFVRLISPFIELGTVEPLALPGDVLYGLVERILKALAMSKLAKRFIQDERALFRQIVEEADRMQDERAGEMVEMVNEIRSIAATNNQVQELLAGIM